MPYFQRHFRFFILFLVVSAYSSPLRARLEVAPTDRIVERQKEEDPAPIRRRKPDPKRPKKVLRFLYALWRLGRDSSDGASSHFDAHVERLITKTLIAYPRLAETLCSIDVTLYRSVFKVHLPTIIYQHFVEQKPIPSGVVSLLRSLKADDGVKVLYEACYALGSDAERSAGALVLSEGDNKRIVISRLSYVMCGLDPALLEGLAVPSGEQCKDPGQPQADLARRIEAAQILFGIVKSDMSNDINNFIQSYVRWYMEKNPQRVFTSLAEVAGAIDNEDIARYVVSPLQRHVQIHSLAMQLSSASQLSGISTNNNVGKVMRRSLITLFARKPSLIRYVFPSDVSDHQLKSHFAELLFKEYLEHPSQQVPGAVIDLFSEAGGGDRFQSVLRNVGSKDGGGKMLATHILPRLAESANPSVKGGLERFGRMLKRLQDRSLTSFVEEEDRSFLKRVLPAIRQVNDGRVGEHQVRKRYHSETPTVATIGIALAMLVVTTGASIWHLRRMKNAREVMQQHKEYFILLWEERAPDVCKALREGPYHMLTPVGIKMIEELCADATKEQKKIFRRFVEKAEACTIQEPKWIRPGMFLAYLGLLAGGALGAYTSYKNNKIIPLGK